MAIPSIVQPKFHTKHPSDGKPYTFRPFVVKEQRAMLIAGESGDPKDVITSMVALVESCTGQSFMSRPLVDLEWAFMNIRAKSVGEIIELTFKCNNMGYGAHSSKPCGHVNHVDVDIRNATYSAMPETLVKITDDISVKLSPVSPRNLIMGHDDRDMAIHNTELIIHGDVFYTEFTEKELVEFYDNIGVGAGNAIQEFFSNQPILTLQTTQHCEKCAAEGKIKIEGVLNFFG